MTKTFYIKFLKGWIACTKSEYKYYAKRGYIGRVSYSVR